MRDIGKDSELLNMLSGSNTLLDTALKRVGLFEEDYILMMELEFEMRPSSDYRRVVLKFVGVTEYYFYDENEHLRDVESLKFFRMANGLYYISLDPYDETEAPSDKDQYLVVAKSVH